MDVTPDWKRPTEGGIGRKKPRKNQVTKASPTTIEAIRLEKCRECRLCGETRGINAHHLISRARGGTWVRSNICGLCGSGTTGCHGLVTANDPDALARLAASLQDDEYAHIIEELGENGMMRTFGVLR